MVVFVCGSSCARVCVCPCMWLCVGGGGRGGAGGGGGGGGAHAFWPVGVYVEENGSQCWQETHLLTTWPGYRASADATSACRHCLGSHPATVHSSSGTWHCLVTGMQPNWDTANCGQGRSGRMCVCVCVCALFRFRRDVKIREINLLPSCPETSAIGLPRALVLQWARARRLLEQVRLVGGLTDELRFRQPHQSSSELGRTRTADDFIITRVCSDTVTRGGREVAATAGS